MALTPNAGRVLPLPLAAIGRKFVNILSLGTKPKPVTDDRPIDPDDLA
ncbi:hypothetical protein QT974_20000 [Microcoleus sp. herbarium12]